MPSVNIGTALAYNAAVEVKGVITGDKEIPITGYTVEAIPQSGPPLPLVINQPFSGGAFEYCGATAGNVPIPLPCAIRVTTNRQVSASSPVTAACTPPIGFIPVGSYQLTCKNIKVTLTCQAINRQGQPIAASFDLTNLVNPDLWNDNGGLKLAADYQPQNGFQPGGSWSRSCTGAKVILTCLAAKIDGTWVPASFDLTNATKVDLWNDNGVLRNAVGGPASGATQKAQNTSNNYTISLANSTALPSAKYGIYVMGFSVGSGVALVAGSGGTLVAGPAAGGTPINSFPVGNGPGQYNTIALSTTAGFVGGRFYFFVVANGSPAPTVLFGQQPPNAGSNPAYPPYSIVELTILGANGGPAQNATIDVQTVDGFVFPLTIALNGGTSNASGNVIFGQPIQGGNPGAIVSRDSIFAAYGNFMKSHGAAGKPYQDLVYRPNSVMGQAGGILNPGAYLTAQDSTGKYLNLASSLHTAFNADLGVLFGSANTQMQVQGVPSNPPGVAGQAYTVTPVTQPYADTGVSLPALKFVGQTDSSTFYIFNPVGASILTDAAGANILGSIANSNGTTTLTLASSVPGLTTGMFVSGAGLSPVGLKSVTTISAINGNVLTLSPALSGGTPAPNSPYVFSVLPYLSMMLTPGQMVLGNEGFFADSSIQFPSNPASASVLASLENFLVTALNRGVGVAAGALHPATTPGNNGTSLFWGTQQNWYPAGATQNLFSLFMHVGAVPVPGHSGAGVPIFLQPYQATTDARGQTMGAAYGFAYDENGGPVPPAPVGPEVPSKFDGTVTPGSSIQITLGPWWSAA